ncbi:site-specific integrase [Actinocorallia longicatena]|uniref:Site-specific integrase n=1 Tax=Actinocorallia longicatena TaxID=111803 RepID=A0ABP6QDY4_9ACTN
MARVDDLWFTKRAPRRKTARHPDNGGSKTAKRWLAVWLDPAGKEVTKAFGKEVDAKRHGARMEADAERGLYVDPKLARMTVKVWCETWLTGYGSRRESTVRQGRVHLERIISEFGHLPLAAVRPSHVKGWTAKLRAEGLADSYVYALHSRLGQVMSDAVHDGLLPRSPVSHRTSPGAAKQRAYVATTDQVWALHDAFPARMRAAILLGAFAGLRVAEVCGLRVADVDFMRGVINPAVQYPDQPLKTETSKTPIPIPQSLALELAAHVARYGGETLLTHESGGQLGPWILEREMRKARRKVDGLPAGFRYHDLRHYFASLLIASGADVKVVQTRLRHASAKTTLDTYAHLWPDRDESTRAAVDAVLVARTEQGQNAVRGAQ